MNIRWITLLFTALFLLGAFPALFLQPFGFASAGVTAGFLCTIADKEYIAVIIIVGLISAWFDGEAFLLLPLCTLLMLVIGALTEINEHMYHAIHVFILGAIILFSLSVSLMRNPSLMVYLAAASVWAYFTGGGFMQDVPPIATPLFFLLGVILSSVLLLAIGVATGITLTDKVRKLIGSFKNSAAFTMFFTLF
jgi:hydrogenase/urease accessory protein HupE